MDVEGDLEAALGDILMQSCPCCGEDGHDAGDCPVAVSMVDEFFNEQPPPAKVTKGKAKGKGRGKAAAKEEASDAVVSAFLFDCVDYDKMAKLASMRASAYIMLVHDDAPHEALRSRIYTDWCRAKFTEKNRGLLGGIDVTFTPGFGRFPVLYKDNVSQKKLFVFCFLLLKAFNTSGGKGRCPLGHSWPPALRRW